MLGLDLDSLLIDHNFRSMFRTLNEYTLQMELQKSITIMTTFGQNSKNNNNNNINNNNNNNINKTKRQT